MMDVFRAAPAWRRVRKYYRFNDDGVAEHMRKWSGI